MCLATLFKVNWTYSQSYKLDSLDELKIYSATLSFFLWIALRASFSFIFVFSCKQYLNQIYVKISIQYWDSKPQPSELESPPVTTRPGLPPRKFHIWMALSGYFILLRHCLRFGFQNAFYAKQVDFSCLLCEAMQWWCI